MRHKAPDDATSSTDLGLLLATEVELEAMLARARETARGLVEDAGREAGTASLELEQQLTAAQADVKAEVNAERARRASEVLAGARRQVEDLDAVPDDRIVVLGRVALERLLKGMAP